MGLLSASEIRDDQLFLQVEIIPNTKSIHLKTPGELILQEVNSPFQIKFNNPDLIIELYKKINVNPIWRVGIKKVDTVEEARDFIRRFPETTYKKNCSLKFYNNKLFQHTEYSILKRKNFKSYDSAKNNSDIDNWITEEFFYDSCEIYVYDQNSGEDYYISAPVRLTASNHISVFEVPKADFWNPKHYITRTYYENMLIKLSRIGKMNLISEVELEKYVAGVVPNEIGINVPVEALRTQAIAARSEALFKVIHGAHRDDGFDLCASVHCQVYSGVTDVSTNIKKAVKSTSYEVAKYDDKIVNTVYSTNCGGITVSSSAAWGGSEVPYLQPVYDNKYNKKLNLNDENSAKRWLRKDLDVFCNTQKYNNWKSKTYRWLKEYTVEEFENLINSKANLGKFERIDILERGKSGRVSKIKISGSKEDLIMEDRLQIRQFFGGLRSTLFLVVIDDTIKFFGKGSGHGVGMCQMGAIEMAHQNYQAEDILKHYFKSIRVEKISLKQTDE